MNKSYDKKYKEYKYLKGLNPRHRDVINIIDENDIDLRNKHILDIGCGEGTLMMKFKEMGADVGGIDLSKEGVNLCKQRGLKARKMDIVEDKIPWSNEFDLVIASEVIEHIFDPFIFLRNINKIIKDRGTIVLTTPNFSYYRWIFKYLLNKTPTQIQNPTHIRFYTLKYLELIVKKQGFDIVDSKCLVGKNTKFKFGRRLVILGKKATRPQYEDIDDYYIHYVKMNRQG